MVYYGERGGIQWVKINNKSFVNNFFDEMGWVFHRKKDSPKGRLLSYIQLDRMQYLTFGLLLKEKFALIEEVK